MKLGAANIAFLGADDARFLQDALTEYLAETSIRCAFLVDRTGRLLTSVGETHGMDQTTFASLASADFAASDQLAALLGEDEFSSLYHHGADRSMFLADISGTAILAALFDTRTTLGMVRIKTKSLVPRLAEYFALMAQRGPTGQVVQMEAGWALETESEIDRLFSE